MEIILQLLTEIAADVRLQVLIGICIVVGVLLGMLGWAWWSRRERRRLELELAEVRGQVKSQPALAEERRLAIQHVEQQLSGVFAELANRSLAFNSDNFLKLATQTLGTHQERARSDLGAKQQAITELIKPIQDALDKTHRQIGEIEKHRHEAFGGINAQLQAMASSQDALQTHTRNLVTALRRPEVRGQWGELTLRRVVELAGMVEHCDFVEQPHTDTGEGAVRPDMV
ncbi:MAG: DNA recombination protein RmuC, partial [Gammaproteobacteria bacterium]